MSVAPKPGARLRSAVCPAEVVVIRAPAELDLRCGGAPMLGKDEAGTADPGPVQPFDGGTQIGKRYTHEALGLEVLCTKAGQGSLAVGDEPLTLKSAKPLPASD